MCLPGKVSRVTRGRWFKAFRAFDIRHDDQGYYLSALTNSTRYDARNVVTQDNPREFVDYGFHGYKEFDDAARYWAHQWLWGRIIAEVRMGGVVVHHSNKGTYQGGSSVIAPPGYRATRMKIVRLYLPSDNASKRRVEAIRLITKRLKLVRSSTRLHLYYP